MRKRFMEEQNIGILREYEAGATTMHLARKHYVWCAAFPLE